MNSIDDRYFLSLDCEVWDVREKAFTDLFNDGVRAVATLVAGAANIRPRVRAAGCSEMSAAEKQKTPAKPGISGTSRGSSGERLRSESNRRWRICNPLP